MIKMKLYFLFIHSDVRKQYFGSKEVVEFFVLAEDENEARHLTACHFYLNGRHPFEYFLEAKNSTCTEIDINTPQVLVNNK